MKACIQALMAGRDDIINEAKHIYSRRIMINSRNLHGQTDNLDDVESTNEQ